MTTAAWQSCTEHKHLSPLQEVSGRFLLSFAHVATVTTFTHIQNPHPAHDCTQLLTTPLSPPQRAPPEEPSLAQPSGQQLAGSTAPSAAISPSTKGNAQGRGWGSPKGLEEAKGQQRARKRLCSSSRSVAGALIPLGLAITLRSFPSEPVPRCTGANPVGRHRGAGSTH